MATFKHISDVRQIVENQMGKKILNIEWLDHVYTWMQWYSGKVDDFHKYRVYNGQQYVKQERQSLGMPKIVSEDWASLLYNDKTDIKVDEAKQEELQEILDTNHFMSNFNDFIEQYMAMGIGATVVFRDRLGKARIDFIKAPMVFPLAVENGEVTSCAFASVQDQYYYINIHEAQPNGSYKVTNTYWKIIGQGSAERIENKNVAEEYISPVKMFQIYKPATSNNIDLFTPYGLSVYANGIDQIKACDLVFDSFTNEFSIGRKRILIRQDAADYKVQVNEKGEQTTVPLFDPTDTVFYRLPQDDDHPSDPIHELQSDLRTQDHIAGLQTALNLCSSACGLGMDRYEFKEGRIYVNNQQVISTQSKLYKNLLKHEKILRESLTEMVKSLFYAQDMAVYTGDVSIDFDDSLIEDSESIQRRALLELNSGLIDPIEYFVQVYKYTEEQAEEFVNKIRGRQPKPEEEPEPEGE